MNPELGAAFICARRHRVLGVPLGPGTWWRRERPFSLWHLFLLQTLESPFARQGAVSLEDLRTAVGVCRLRFPDHHVRRPRLGLRTLYRLMQRGGLEREVLAFLAYAGDYLAKPQFAIRPIDVPRMPGAPAPAPRMPGTPAPELLRIVCDVLDLTKWPEEKVWNMGVGRAQWYRVEALRLRGLDVDFGSDHEAQFEADMKAAGLKPYGHGRT